MTKPTARPTLTIKETAKLLGIGKNQAYEAARRGELQTMKVGNRVLVLRVPLMKRLNGEAA